MFVVQNSSRSPLWPNFQILFIKTFLPTKSDYSSFESYEPGTRLNNLKQRIKYLSIKFFKPTLVRFVEVRRTTSYSTHRTGGGLNS